METLEKTAPVGVRDERISPLGACLSGQKWKDFGCSVVTLGKKSPGGNKLSQCSFETPREEEALFDQIITSQR